MDRNGTARRPRRCRQFSRCAASFFNSRWSRASRPLDTPAVELWRPAGAMRTGRMLVAGASPAAGWRSVVGDRGRMETATGQGFNSRRVHHSYLSQNQQSEPQRRYKAIGHGARTSQNLLLQGRRSQGRRLITNVVRDSGNERGIEEQTRRTLTQPKRGGITKQIEPNAEEIGTKSTRYGYRIPNLKVEIKRPKYKKNQAEPPYAMRGYQPTQGHRQP